MRKNNFRKQTHAGLFSRMDRKAEARHAHHRQRYCRDRNHRHAERHGLLRPA
jgi:hypothetical protein